MAHSLPEWELFAYAIVFAQYENGNKTWDWNSMKFVGK